MTAIPKAAVNNSPMLFTNPTHQEYLSGFQTLDIPKEDKEILITTVHEVSDMINGKLNRINILFNILNVLFNFTYFLSSPTNSHSDFCTQSVKHDHYS